MSSLPVAAAPKTVNMLVTDNRPPSVLHPWAWQNLRWLVPTVVAMITMATGLHLRAQIILLSDDRHIDVSTLAGAQDGSTSSSDSRVAKSFLDFDEKLVVTSNWTDKTPGPGGIPEHAESEAGATQDSVLSLTELVFHSLVEVNASGNNAGAFEMVDANALSFFQVSFSVTTPIVFNLSFFDARGYVGATGGATYDKAFDLTSSTSGSILGLPVIIDLTAFYTGLLQPGETYTLLVSQQAHTNIPDPFGSGVQNTLEAHLTVPEPSVSLSVIVGLGLLTALRLKSRSARRLN